MRRRIPRFTYEGVQRASAHPGQRPAGHLRHGNLLSVTHERTADLESAVGVHYYRHISTMVKAGHAVRYDPGDPRHSALPTDYLANAAEIATPILFLTGDRNHVFTDSNIVCHELLSKASPARHELEIIPGYGHQDTFAGKNADRDVFPRMVRFLREHADGAGRTMDGSPARG